MSKVTEVENGHKISGEKKKQKSKVDFDSLYEQLQTDNPILMSNKKFWIRKGNSQKYVCILCNISIQTSTNLNILKSRILNHVEDKYHKKRFESNSLKETNAEVNHHLENNITPLIEDQSVVLKENKTEKHSSSLTQEYLEKRFTSNLLKESDTKVNQHLENNITPLIEKQSVVLKQNKTEKNSSSFVQETEIKSILIQDLNMCSDFDTVYDSFEQSNPVTKSSRDLITKQDGGRYFLCTLCNIMIFNSLNSNEFRYNLWVHLNDEHHRERLPNFLEVQKTSQKVIKDLSKALPSCYHYDLQFFEIGPVFRFIKCSLCEVAVSNNLHRLENHVRGGEHTKRKKLFSEEGIKQEIPPNHTRIAFRKLIVKLKAPFMDDIKYIQIGKIPGYVVCTLCTYVILPTEFYVQTHVESKNHQKNKAENPLSGKCKQRTPLKELMKNLPEDLLDYNIFKEDMCGLTCQRCNVCIPATSYDLYSHITKERLAVLN